MIVWCMLQDTVSELPKKQPAVEESEASFLDESVAEDSFTESFIEEKAEEPEPKPNTAAAAKPAAEPDVKVC